MRVSTTTYTFIATIILVLTAACLADVRIAVYYADGISPLALRDPNVPDIYVDVMVGTHLSIVLSSDTDTILWYGRLGISEFDATRVQLWPCDYNELSYDREESCSILADARSISGMADPPLVNRVESGTGGHFVAMYGTEDPNTGDWFTIDYHAIGLGECIVYLIEQVELPLPPMTPGPIPAALELVKEIMFTHVQTRDFDDSHVVDFSDFALMAMHLNNSESSDPNDFSPEYDFDQNQSIDGTDLSMFMDFWLTRTR